MLHIKNNDEIFNFSLLFFFKFSACKKKILITIRFYIKLFFKL